MKRLLFASATALLMIGTSLPALAAVSAADCQSLFYNSDVNRDGVLQADEASSFLESIGRAQVQLRDPAQINQEEFLAACQKDAFINVSPGTGMGAATPDQPAEPTLATPEGFMASQLIGATVSAPNNETVGEVKDVVFAPSGEVTHVIVEAGDKNVEVERSQLTITASEDGLKVVTEAKLAELPAVNVAGMEQQAQPPATTTDQTTTAQQTAPEQPAATIQQQQPAQEQTTAETTAEQQTSTEQQPAASEQPSAASEQQVAGQTGTAEQQTTAKQPATSGTSSPDQPASQEQPADTASPSTAPAEQQVATAPQPAPKEQPAEQALAIPEGLLVSDLMGADVYSSDNESMGEINDVVLAGQGQKPQVIIGVGGFFGIGEKDVPVELSQLQFTTTEDGIRITLNATKAEIEGLAAK